MATDYIAVICDAVASRSLASPNRARLQSALREAVRKELNHHSRPWRRSIAAKFALTRGDEIEGLLRNTRHLWEITHWLRARFGDVDWVVACARGPITTPLVESALEVDGPCFHDARAALETAKHDRLLFAFRGFDDNVAALAQYYSALYWSWTPKQRRAANSWRYTAGLEASFKPALLQRTVSAVGRMHPSAVSHMRRRMAWPLVVAGDIVFRAALEGP